MKAMASGSETEVQDLLAMPSATLSELVRAQNYAGMTVVHVAARMRRPDWVQAFLGVSPSAASLVTFSTGKPEGWTALHCVLDAKPASAAGL